MRFIVYHRHWMQSILADVLVMMMDDHYAQFVNAYK
jgi:hypothetical protein